MSWKFLSIFVLFQFIVLMAFRIITKQVSEIDDTREYDVNVKDKKR